MNFKYNYIILGSEWDLYRHSYSDIISLPNVQYIAGPNRKPNSLMGYIYRFHFNSTINNVLNLPFKKIWNNYYFENIFKTDDNLCFLVFTNWLTLNIDILQHLRKKYPNAKIVWMCQDLVSTQHLLFTNELFNAKYFISQCDLAISFDPGDCEKYGFVYHSLVFSSENDNPNCSVHNDVYFLGKAKNRLLDIIQIYDKCQELGLVCDFNIVGADNYIDSLYRPGIHYISGMTYEENLQHVKQTKCLLEIMQKGGRGFTQRVCEAICYDKLLITDNAEIANTLFYNPNYISIINGDNLDKEFVKTISSKKHIDYHFKDQISPANLLSFIESRI